MNTEVIVLIISNILVPITVAIITGAFQAKKYKKEIQILKISQQNEIEKLKIQYKNQQELEKQIASSSVINSLVEKVSDEIIKQPATQKMINQRTKQSFITRK